MGAPACVACCSVSTSSPPRSDSCSPSACRWHWAGSTPPAGRRSPSPCSAAILVTMLAIGSQGLYRSRTCAVRAVETVRLGRAVAVATVVALLAANAMSLSVGIGSAIAAVAVTWFLLSATRGLYSAWLRKRRMPGPLLPPGRRGRHRRRGLRALPAGRAAPRARLRVSGVVGPRHSLARGTATCSGSARWPTPTSRSEAAGANGVIVAVSDIAADDLNHLTRELLRDGVHVQLSSGLRGIDRRRLRSVAARARAALLPRAGRPSRAGSCAPSGCSTSSSPASSS